MPVGLLLCEGVPQGPDVRLLSALIGDLRVTVLPAGDKYGLPNRVLARREVQGVSSIVAAIRDCDFDLDPPAEGIPGIWHIRPNNQPIWTGWHWERVEIENYLADPVVVANALNMSADGAAAYREAFAEAAEGLADYTAARYALSRSRRWKRLENRWGVAAGLKDHLIPAQRDNVACRAGMLLCLNQYRDLFPSDVDLLERYEQALILYGAAGPRGRQPEVYYSGKDLVCALGPALAQMGLGEPGKVRERILGGIERSLDPVWEWLPEWRELRRLLQAVATHHGP